MKSYKPLLDQYKNQVGDLEEKLAASTKETERLSFELERTIQALKSAEDERDARDAQQRVMEMENIGQELAARKAARTTDPQSPNNSNQLAIPSDSDDEGASAANDSFDTNTMTQLRLQVRQLQKQAAAASSGTDSSRTLVLQNLLDDANRMKERYEADYLAEMRAKLKAEGQLEEVRKAAGRDDGPTTIALRLRLNEIVEELDALKKEHAQTAQQLETVEKELVVAKSNRKLFLEFSLEKISNTIPNPSEPCESRSVVDCQQTSLVGLSRKYIAPRTARRGQKASRISGRNTQNAEQSDSEIAPGQNRASRRLHQSKGAHVGARAELLRTQKICVAGRSSHFRAARAY